MNPRILLDMDGVLADFRAGIDQAVVDAGGHAATDNGWTSFELEGVYPDHANVLRHAIRQPGFYANLPAIAGALDAVDELVAEGFNIWVCTAPVRNRWCPGEKLDWVQRHLGRDIAGRTIITKDKTVVDGDLLIDDKPHVTGANHPAWTHVRFTQPYNQHLDVPRIDRWDWTTVVADFIELLGRPAA